MIISILIYFLLQDKVAELLKVDLSTVDPFTG